MKTSSSMCQTLCTPWKTQETQGGRGWAAEDQDVLESPQYPVSPSRLCHSPAPIPAPLNDDLAAWDSFGIGYLTHHPIYTNLMCFFDHPDLNWSCTITTKINLPSPLNSVSRHFSGEFSMTGRVGPVAPVPAVHPRGTEIETRLCN